MASSRDQGLQSLQSGDVAGAIQQLEAACAADGTDYLAHIYLGAAYSQANRTMDAIQVLTRSVELQPSNAQGRYNLGLAMERGGFTEQAATAYEQAIMLQPDYPKAREALQRIKGGAAIAAPAPTQQPAPPAQQSGYGAPPQYGGVGAASFGAPPAGTPAPLYGTAQPVAAPATQYIPPPGQPYPGANPSPPPYGTPQYGMNPPPQYGVPQGSAYPQQPMPTAEPSGLANYGAPPARQAASPPPYGTPYGAPAQSPYGSQRPLSSQRPMQAAERESFAGSVGMALFMGAIGGVVGTAIWVTIILTTHYSVGIIGLFVGGIVGFLIKKGNGGGSTTGGILASIITVVSSIAGNAIAIAILQPTNGNLGSIGFSIAGIFIAYRVASSD